MREWTPPTTPTGGGFSVSNFSLGYLYEQYKFGNNIWTSSNVPFDLCRYTGCKIEFYRHEFIDFVVYYNRNYPMTIDEWTYPRTHPHSILLRKHKIIIPSRYTKPRGKNTIKKFIKPPRQMTNKWFFMDTFESTPILMLQAAAADLTFVSLGKYSENQLMNFFYINDKFYLDKSWGKSISTGYRPVGTWTTKVTGKYLQGGEQTLDIEIPVNTYSESVNIDKGWFQTRVLRLISITSPIAGVLPTGLARYNPTIDTGKGNSIWLVSTIVTNYNKPTDKILYKDNLPLWLALYGWTDYVLKLKKDPTFLESYCLVIQSPAIQSSKTQPHSFYLPIDESFIQGKGPYDSPVYPQEKNKWYPTLKHQQKTINNIVKCGPFIPRPEGKASNWELHLKTTFYFKWGGADSPEAAVADPSTKPTYAVPDTIHQTVQIKDPRTQKPESLFHTWDYRRGSLTATAIKRMQQNLPDESISSTDSDYHSPLKRIKLSKRDPPGQEKETKVLKCLQTLFEENTFQETKETEDPLNLLQQQQQQQQSDKYQLLQLLTYLKKRQRQLQLQAGLID